LHPLFFAAPFILILIISKHSAHLQIVQTKHQNTKSHYHHYPTSLVHKMQIVVKKMLNMTCSHLFIFGFPFCFLFPAVPGCSDIVFSHFHNFIYCFIVIFLSGKS